MTSTPAAGQPADPAQLVDIDRLIAAYYDIHPDPSAPSQRVAFGTSGHRGSAFNAAFNEDHILAVVEATCRYREQAGIDGPLFLGRDTHGLSLPAFQSSLEVLAAHEVDVQIDAADGYTPTPALSHAILTANRGRREHLADGIVITPSHNPPEDGGIKYNPPNGGPADTDVTGWIEAQANRFLETGLQGVRRSGKRTAAPYDYVNTYVDDLKNIVQLDAVRDTGLKLGVDPLGGASLAYLQAIPHRCRPNPSLVNPRIDPTFGLLTHDWDGHIRPDPSSTSALSGVT